MHHLCMNFRDQINTCAVFLLAGSAALSLATGGLVDALVIGADVADI